MKLFNYFIYFYPIQYQKYHYEAGSMSSKHLLTYI